MREKYGVIANNQNTMDCSHQTNFKTLLLFRKVLILIVTEERFHQKVQMTKRQVKVHPLQIVTLQPTEIQQKLQVPTTPLAVRRLFFFLINVIIIDSHSLYLTSIFRITFKFRISKSCLNPLCWFVEILHDYISKLKPFGNMKVCFIILYMLFYKPVSLFVCLFVCIVQV